MYDRLRSRSGISLHAPRLAATKSSSVQFWAATSVQFWAAANKTAEINLHLGTRFWLDMERRYGDGKLPLVLSAYNAGPTRARRWRRLPEFADPLRFTERIPFDETRGYVKAITRNIGLYQFLYGDE